MTQNISSSEKSIYLVRFRHGNAGTFGRIVFEGYPLCYTGELPWRDNTNDISCIPAGSYRAVRTASTKFGPHFWIQNVPDRTGILMHTGNYCGDRSLGFLSDTLGCVLPGSALGYLNSPVGKQYTVRASRSAMAKLLAVLPKTFNINVMGGSK